MLPPEHGIDDKPRKALILAAGELGYGLVESSAHPAIAGIGVVTSRMRRPMRSRLDCSQQGDLSSAPLIAQEKTRMA